MFPAPEGDLVVADQVFGPFSALRRLFAVRGATDGDLLGREGHRKSRHGHDDRDLAQKLSGTKTEE